MTPKEKAKEIFAKMYDWQLVSVKLNTPSVAMEIAKQCALISVDEILIEYRVLMIETEFCYDQFKYWQEVKQEIQAL